MRKVLILLTALALVAGFSTISYAGISGTPHDFSSATGPNPLYRFSDQICVICHAPHNATPGDEPLWNHTLSTATYAVYTSSTMSQTPGQPGGYSKLCLSCHDGTVALDSFGGAAGGTFISGTYNLGSDLSDDHPISITYADAYAQGGFFSDTSLAPAVLFGGLVECASCHEPHDYTFSDFLRESNTGSQLCIRCHNK